MGSSKDNNRENIFSPLSMSETPGFTEVQDEKKVGLVLFVIYLGVFEGTSKLYSSC